MAGFLPSSKHILKIKFINKKKDLIKTFIQSERDKSKFKPIYRDGGITNCCKYIYKQNGLIGFWRGYGICTVRAIYANSFLYCAFEHSRELIRTLVTLGY